MKGIQTFYLKIGLYCTTFGGRSPYAVRSGVVAVESGGFGGGIPCTPAPLPVVLRARQTSPKEPCPSWLSNCQWLLSL